MPKQTYRFPCPCCQKMLEFDTATGTARKVHVVKAGDAAALDELVAKHKRDTERLGDEFSRAADDVATQADKFDDLLNDALEAAKKEKGKPPSPFDLD